jgi:hypothetical protein
MGGKPKPPGYPGSEPGYPGSVVPPGRPPGPAPMAVMYGTGMTAPMAVMYGTGMTWDPTWDPEAPRFPAPVVTPPSVPTVTPPSVPTEAWDQSMAVAAARRETVRAVRESLLVDRLKAAGWEAFDAGDDAAAQLLREARERLSELLILLDE